MQFNSIKFKITVLYTVALGFILLFYSAILYFSLSYTLYADLDAELKTKAQALEQTVTDYTDTLGYNDFSVALQKSICLSSYHRHQAKIKELEQTWLKKVDKFNLKEDYIIFWDLNGKPIVKSKNFHPKIFFSFKKRLDTSYPGIIFQNLKLKKRNLRIIYFSASYRNKERYIIQIGTSRKPIINILENRSLYIMSSIPILLLLSGFLGHFLTLRILRPVLQITKTATSITHEDLSARINAKHLDKEMKYLVNAFNDMIARLDKSFKHIGEFSANVAHELKTPLAIIRGECEVALRKARDVEEYERVLKVNLEEIKRMLKTIEDLLLLTKLEYKPESIKLEPIELMKFIKEMYEQTRILASPKNISIELNGNADKLQVKGDILALRRLFFNLMSNAIKFISPQGKIVIKVKTDNNTVVISISDSGIGIPQEDMPKIFDRFFHVDRLPENKEQGNGLGLSIALSIARIHHGDIKVESEYGKGTTFQVILPLV